ncbi:hypothetical protein BC829DRAFT_438866 [Chytridium lagenaria]|nr:hypothetical protein BC829DRAFT_438866 [Chytridium lagenaria]
MLLLPLILCAFQGAAVSALGYRLTVAVFTDSDMPPHSSQKLSPTQPGSLCPLDAAFAVPNIRAEGDTTPAPVLTSQIIKQLLTVNLIDATTGTSMILFATSDADVVGTPGDDLTPSSTPPPHPPNHRPQSVELRGKLVRVPSVFWLAPHRFPRR